MRFTIDRLSSNPDVQRIIRAAFPSYRKHRAVVEDFPDHGVNVNSYWDGGSRDEFALVELSTMRTKPLPTSSHPFFDLKGATGENEALVATRGNVTLKYIPVGFALVQAGTFCGKPSTATVYVNPANMPRQLTGGR